MIDIIDDFPLLPANCVLSRVFFSLDVISFGKGTSLDHDHSSEHTCNVFPLQPREMSFAQKKKNELYLKFRIEMKLKRKYHWILK